VCAHISPSTHFTKHTDHDTNADFSQQWSDQGDLLERVDRRHHSRCCFAAVAVLNDANTIAQSQFAAPPLAGLAHSVLLPRNAKVGAERVSRIGALLRRLRRFTHALCFFIRREGASLVVQHSAFLPIQAMRITAGCGDGQNCSPPRTRVLPPKPNAEQVALVHGSDSS